MTRRGRFTIMACGGLAAAIVVWALVSHPRPSALVADRDSVPLESADVIASGKPAGSEGPQRSADSSRKPEAPPQPSTRAILAEEAKYRTITDPLERLLTARGEEDAAWMSENYWPTIEAVRSLDTARDCRISELGNGQFSIDDELPRAQACLARLAMDNDPRLLQATESVNLVGSAFKARLLLSQLLARPITLSDHERIASLAIEAWELGDSTALDEVVRSGGVRQLPFYFWLSALERARNQQMYAQRRRPTAQGARPRPFPRD